MNKMIMNECIETIAAHYARAAVAKGLTTQAEIDAALAPVAERIKSEIAALYAEVTK